MQLMLAIATIDDVVQLDLRGTCPARLIVARNKLCIAADPTDEIKNFESCLNVFMRIVRESLREIDDCVLLVQAANDDCLPTNFINAINSAEIEDDLGYLGCIF